jgi:hypothetical protein
MGYPGAIRTYAEVVIANGKQLLQNWLQAEMNVIGTAEDQKPTGKDGIHRVGCHTATWKERSNHDIMISKQQRKH